MAFKRACVVLATLPVPSENNPFSLEKTSSFASAGNKVIIKTDNAKMPRMAPVERFCNDLCFLTEDIIIAANTIYPIVENVVTIANIITITLFIDILFDIFIS